MPGRGFPKGGSKRPNQLADAIQRHLRSRYGALSEKQVLALSRQFVAAGLAAVQGQHGSAKQANAALRTHRSFLAKARGRLSELSIPGKGPVSHTPAFQHALLAAREAWPDLCKRPGVIGFGAGFRYKDGVRTSEPCAIIAVTKKISREKLSRSHKLLQPYITAPGQRRFPIDVLELGTISRYASPGDRLALQTDVTNGATLGIFAIDNKTHRQLALTAMHASEINDYPPVSRPGDAIEFVINDSKGSRTLGTLLRGTQTDIDAAAIDLTDDGQVSNFIPGIGEVTHWRALDAASDTGAPVRMLGAKTNHVVNGSIEQTTIYIPEQNLGPAIVADISAVGGDSGAALVDHDCFLLGLLVGGSITRQVFSPIGNVFDKLDCNLL